MIEHAEYPEDLVHSLLGATTRVVAVLDSERNHVWRVRCGTDDLVVRLSGKRPPKPIVDFERSIAMQTVAASYRLAPPVIAFDVDHELSITEYVDSDLGTMGEQAFTEQLDLIVPVLRSLHAVPTDGLPTGPTDLQIFEGYGVSVDELPSEIAPSMRWDTSTHVVCHHDVNMRNVRRAQRTVLIDWEYSRCADPLHELAVLAKNLELSDRQGAALLERYFGPTVDSLVRERFKVYRRRAGLWFALWSKRYQ
ncbi:MAG: phosphotransferase [Pseudomonadota bacterium]